MNHASSRARLKAVRHFYTRSLVMPAALAPLAVTALGADPFVGTWQLKLDRSTMPSTYRFLAVGEGKFQTDNGVGLGPVLTVDGSPQESPLGGTASLKRIDDHTYLYMLKRKSLYKRTVTLDGDRMKWAEDQELDTGQHDIFESKWMRVGHGDGLAGEWRRVSLTAPFLEKATFTIRAIPNGFAAKSSTTNFEEKTYFDGKEHADAYPDGVNKIVNSAELWMCIPTGRLKRESEKFCLPRRASSPMTRIR